MDQDSLDRLGRRGNSVLRSLYRLASGRARRMVQSSLLFRPLKELPRTVRTTSLADKRRSEVTCPRKKRCRPIAWLRRSQESPGTDWVLHRQRTFPDPVIVRCQTGARKQHDSWGADREVRDGSNKTPCRRDR